MTPAEKLEIVMAMLWIAFPLCMLWGCMTMADGFGRADKHGISWLFCRLCLGTVFLMAGAISLLYAPRW